MSIFETVYAGIKSAMLARDKQRLEALQLIKAAFLIVKTAPESKGEVTDEAAIKTLVRLHKQHVETAELFAQNNRNDLAEQERFQAGVIAEFLPKPLTPEELTAAVRDIIAKTGATSMKDMGKVMGMATKQLAGKADGKSISAKVKELLA